MTDNDDYYRKPKSMKNFYDQDVLDSCVSEYFIFNDAEDGITICLNGDIEL